MRVFAFVSLVSLVLASVLPGCAPTLSTLQTARPLAPGRVRVSVATGLLLPGGALFTLVREGTALGRRAREAAARGETFRATAEEAQGLLSAGLALAVAPPGTSQELMVRLGLVDRLDAGLRLSSTGLRLDGKLLLLHGGDGEDVPARERHTRDLAVGLGLSRHLFSNPVLDALAVVQLADFSRWDLEVPLYLSADFGQVLKLYAAPKYVLSRMHLEGRLLTALEEGGGAAGADVRLPRAATGHFAGATVGVAAGYRWVHVYAELTTGYTFLRVPVLGRTRQLGGPSLFPAVGLAVNTDTP